VEVECLPQDIPDNLTLDVTNIGLGQSILVADVDFGEKVNAVYDDNFAVVGVLAPRSVASESEDEEEAAE
jgi:large subunit ribosomal protein L25